MSNARSAEAAAIKLLGETYAGGPPVPVEQITAAQGARLTYEAYEGNVSGLLYRDKDLVVIGVDSRAPTRQRFTIAHELGHLIMHKGQRVFVDRLVRMNLRDGSSSVDAAMGGRMGYLGASDEAVRQALIGAGLTEWFANALVGLNQDYRRSGTGGYAAQVTSTIQRLAGRQARSLDDLLGEIAHTPPAT